GGTKHDPELFFHLFLIFSHFITNLNLLQFLLRNYSQNFLEKLVVILSFFAPNIKTIRNVEEQLKQTFSDIISTNTITGGEIFHFHDW
ncbi:MAG: hypothetical protein ACW97Z_14785, partial [Candidatus Hodarchaeales archaeon]